jgi:curved DNA-binding protein
VPAFKDYYRILGVAEAASAEEIKRAYRTLARTFHPDVNKAKDAQARFVEVGEAYEALSDPKKRAAYDQLRKLGVREGEEIGDLEATAEAATRARAGGAGGNGGGFDGATDEAGGFGGFRSTQIDPEAFSDFFQELFGHARRGGAGGGAGRGGARRTAFQERGEDVEHALEVALEEAYRGGARRLQMEVVERGADGRPKRGSRTIDVRIPSGVEEGTRIRLRGQGEPGETPELAGDLYLVVHLAPHPHFTVSGRTVHLSLPVTPAEAVLGASVAVPTLGGTVQLAIPAGSVAGSKLRLRGRGLPGEPPGDQIVTLTISVPAHPSERERELYRQLAAASTDHPRSGMGV